MKLLFLLALVVAVDRSKFHTCSQVGFCRRNRDRSPLEYEVSRESVAFSGSTLTAALGVKGSGSFPLTLEITTLADSTFRVVVDEKAPLRQRLRISDLIEEVKPVQASFRSEGDVATLSSGANTLKLSLSKLQLDFFTNDELVMSANSRSLFHLEQYRQKQQPAPAPVPAPAEGEAQNEAQNEVQNEVQPETQPEVSASTELDGAWEEDKDTKPFGPSAVMMDLHFSAKHVYGIPEHASDFALKSTRGSDGAVITDPYRLYNLDVFEYELDEVMALYGSVPMMLAHDAKRTIGVYWANPSETFIDVQDASNGGKHTTWISESGVLELFVFLGSDVASVLRQYTSVTGKPYLPPMFSIAYHQCRWNYKDEVDVKQVDAAFDEYDMAYDVIWLDIEHTDGKRYFTWDKNKFGEPERMQENIASKGRRMVTIIDPHIKRDDAYYVYEQALARDLFVRDASGNVYDGWCWPGSSSYLDFSEAPVRDWWSEQFQYTNYKGSSNILFTWNDMNEPSVFNGPEVSMHKDAKHRHGAVEHRELHNAYGMYMHMATYDGLLKRNRGENARPFVLSRAFFAGSQKWGAVWTGDNTAEWEHLEYSIPMLLTLGSVGIPFGGADVGGFFEKTQNFELFTRWYQAGAYQPFFRGHGHLDTKRREPWLFGEPHTSHIREAIRQRYAMLPFWYTLFEEASRVGMPPMRALWMQFPNDENTFAIDRSYMLGDALLVQPVTKAAQLSSDVYLPRGRWFEVATWREFAGAQRVSVDTPLDRIPVFQRGGSVIVKQERPRRSSTQMRGDPYTLQIALDEQQSARGSLYLDDGESFEYARSGVFARLEYSLSGRVLSSALLEGSYRPSNVIERIRIVGIASPRSVKNGANTLEFDYDEAQHVLTIRKPQFDLASQWKLEIN